MINTMDTPASSSSAPVTNVISKMSDRAKLLFLKRIFSVLAFAVFALSTFGQSFSPLNLPLYFEATKNQTEFLANGSGYQFIISPGGVQILLGDSSGHVTASMLLAGGNADAKVHGDREMAGKINYLIGDKPDQWQAGLPTFAQVQVADV